jgi:hypothetical protein
MIGKAGTGSDFGGLAQYLATGREGDSPERVEWVEARNLPTTDHRLVPAIMTATAALSHRVEKPVYHLSISWPEDDGIDPTAMMSIADRTLEDLGLADHQAVIVAHNDTEHPHLHMMVNRVHPETGKAWSNSLDFKRIETSLRAQEIELELRQVPGRHTDRDQGRSMRRRPSRTERARRLRLGETELALFSAVETNEVREQLKLALEESQSWEQLLDQLRNSGYQLQRKGQGLIVVKDGGYAKFSQVTPRAHRLKELERRFGESFDGHTERQLQSLMEVESLDDGPTHGLRRSRAHAPLNLSEKEIEAELKKIHEERRNRRPSKDRDR